jgi:hypothetical protein
MNRGRPVRTSGQVGSASRLLPCSVRKRCRDTDHQRELSLLRAVREAGLTQPDLRRHPQELHHAGDKSVNVNECPWWTREGATGVLQDRAVASGLEARTLVVPVLLAGGRGVSPKRPPLGVRLTADIPCSAWHGVVGAGSLARSGIRASGKHKTLAFQARGRSHLDRADAERVADGR